MGQAVEESVIRYIETNRYLMIDNWMHKVMVDDLDLYEEWIRLNGFSMMDLVVACLADEGIDEHLLEQLAHKVASERLEENVNIGEFVYNVNIGRTEIFEHLPNMNLSIQELHPIVHKINYCFDKFLYFAVSHYTELKNQVLDEQSSLIEQTHKDHLTILGQLSSSFVHEFRNPLTSILGFVQLLQERHPSLEYLDVLTKELNQLKFRINQFLLVSKKGIEYKEKERFHVASTFEETLDFLYPMIVASDVAIEHEIDDAIYLQGHRDEFRQVLINILMNSLEALSDCQRKCIRIRGDIQTGSATITISNNGPTISKATISSIFEPFVSTKKLGTGIGLYVCRKIIQDHQGAIECESNDDWTTFRLSIPLAI